MALVPGDIPPDLSQLSLILFLLAKTHRLIVLCTISALLDSVQRGSDDKQSMV
jgi:hypothetical protein